MIWRNQWRLKSWIAVFTLHASPMTDHYPSMMQVRINQTQWLHHSFGDWVSGKASQSSRWADVPRSVWSFSQDLRVISRACLLRFTCHAISGVQLLYRLASPESLIVARCVFMNVIFLVAKIFRWPIARLTRMFSEPAIWHTAQTNVPHLPLVWITGNEGVISFHLMMPLHQWGILAILSLYAHVATVDFGPRHNIICNVLYALGKKNHVLTSCVSKELLLD